MSNTVKDGDIVCLRSDGTRKVVMTVEGPARGREDYASVAAQQYVARPDDVSCVWVDSNGNVRHDDFGRVALIKVKEQP